MEWCRNNEVEIVFVSEVYIEKNSRGTQSHPSFVLMSSTKTKTRVMMFLRKGMEEEMKIVKEEDNHIILQEKNKKKIEGVYVNRKWHRERWKDWLGSLEEEMGRDGSLLGDWNAYSHSLDKTREEDARGKIMEE